MQQIKEYVGMLDCIRIDLINQIVSIATYELSDIENDILVYKVNHVLRFFNIDNIKELHYMYDRVRTNYTDNLKIKAYNEFLLKLDVILCMHNIITEEG